MQVSVKKVKPKTIQDLINYVLLAENINLLRWICYSVGWAKKMSVRRRHHLADMRDVGQIEGN